MYHLKTARSYMVPASKTTDAELKRLGRRIQIAYERELRTHQDQRAHSSQRISLDDDDETYLDFSNIRKKPNKESTDQGPIRCSEVPMMRDKESKSLLFDGDSLETRFPFEPYPV